jgi:tRNA A-37 threonylcarbamoyl transferase component Bud32/tetratricopeptide (TPR) repeat protein
MSETSVTTAREQARPGEPSTDRSLPWPAPDFEQRRAIDSVRGRLFGRRVEHRIGRYLVERRLGAGGMGEVYLANDDALERRVAIKRVRSELDRASEHERLRDEARLLARLSHGNVVQIYEVGEHEGQTFLAMEYVEGTTLAAWLAAAPRRWPDILAVFVAAGRGLAAAHSAGVVHRDFKPDNVLIGKDGRVCVVDFGLALAHAQHTPGALVQPLEIAGTIRYMPLEQLRGQAVDARSDQFAFCVALCEALWQHAPFDPRNALRRALELEADRPTPPPFALLPRRGEPPRRLWAIVRRGLQREGAARWPAIDELLAALEAVPRRRRRLAWAAGLAPLVALGLAALTRPAAPDACAALEHELAGVWDEASGQALVESLSSSGVPHAPATAERVVAHLDGWAEVWLAQRSEQCRSADAPELARARRACLAQQREQVAVWVATLDGRDPLAIDRAIPALDALPDPRACSLDALVEGPPLPALERVDAVEQLRAQLAEQRSLRALGRFDPDAALRLRDAAAAIGDPALDAEAQAELALANLEGGDPRAGITQLDEAARLALAADHPRVLADSWTTLALHELSTMPNLEHAADRLALAEAAWARLPGETRGRARTTYARARVAALRGDATQAVVLHRAALEQLEQLDAADDPNLPGFVAGLASALEPSDPAAALHEREAALAAAERIFGPDHPKTAEFAYDLGAALEQRERSDEATALFERAITIWTHAHGRPHPQLARAHLLLAHFALAAGDLAAASRHAQALRDIHDATLPADHVDRGDAAMLRSRIAALRGERGEALAAAREALRLWSPGAEPSADHIVELRLDIAAAELGLDELDAAGADYRALLALPLGPAHEGLARLGLAELALRRGHLDAAAAELAQIDPAALDGQQTSYELLTGLAAIRTIGTGPCPDCEAIAERIADALAREGWTPELLAPWLAELGLSPLESERLGFH